MATLSDLVTLCADHKLDGAPTLAQFARELREAGRVSTGGRGRGGARMTYLDAARFLIACASTDHPKRAADTEAVFSAIQMTESVIRSENRVETHRGDKTPLDEGLATALEQLANGSLDAIERERAEDRADKASGHIFYIRSSIRLDVIRSGASARLQVGRNDYSYDHPAKIRLIEAPIPSDLIALSEAWMRETERFRSGKNLVASLHNETLRAVANAVAGNPVNAERPSTVTAPGASAPGQIEDEA